MDDRAKPMFGHPISYWHRWFAWHPVRTFDGRWKWLAVVQRRLVQKNSWLTAGEPLTQWWQYRVC